MLMARTMEATRHRISRGRVKVKKEGARRDQKIRKATELEAIERAFSTPSQPRVN